MIINVIHYQFVTLPETMPHHYHEQFHDYTKDGEQLS